MTIQERLDGMVALLKAGGHEVLDAGLRNDDQWCEITFKHADRRDTTVEITFLGNEWMSVDEAQECRDDYTLYSWEIDNLERVCKSIVRNYE